MNPLIGVHFFSLQLTSSVILYHYPQREECLVFVRSSTNILIDFQHWKFINNKWASYLSTIQKEAKKLIRKKKIYFLKTHLSKEGRFEKDWGDILGYYNGNCLLNPLWEENGEFYYDGHRVLKSQVYLPIPDQHLYPILPPLGGIILRSLEPCRAEQVQQYDHDLTFGECFCVKKGLVHRGWEWRWNKKVNSIHHLCPLCFILTKRPKKHMKEVHQVNRWPTLLDVKPPLEVHPIPIELFSLVSEVEKKQPSLEDEPIQHLYPIHDVKTQHLHTETIPTNKLVEEADVMHESTSLNF